MSGQASSGKSNPQATPQQIIDLYTKYLPQTAGVTFGQSGDIATSLANAAAGSNPIYTASGLQQLQQFAPGYAQAGNQISQINAGGQADLLAGEGGRAAINADALNRTVNPDYYNTRTQLAGDASKLLSSFNGGVMSGGELAAAERAINQSNSATGNLGNVSPYSTVSNALNFGDYARQKQQAYGNAINTVTGTLGGLQNTSFDPVATALNSGNASSNFALGQFNTGQGNPLLGEASNFGSNIFGSLAGIGGSSNSRQNSGGGGIQCCFIFLEACDGILPVHVRKCRDKYYAHFPQIAEGYKRMAKWLVPLMQQSTLITNLVRLTMVKPLTQYGYFVIRKSPTSKKYKPFRKFWFSVWNFLGR